MKILGRHFFLSITFMVLSWPQCQNSRATTDSLISAEFLNAGYQRISLIAPSDATPVSGYPVLAWTEPAPISRYRVQIALDTAFSNLVVNVVASGSTYAVSQSDLIGINAFEGREYYWRVSGAVNGVLMSKTGTIQIIESGVVYVAAGSTNTLQVGNRTAPFKKIGPGLVSADTRRGGSYAKTFEVRVAAGVYNEDVLLLPAISLRGGFTFSAGNGAIAGGLNSSDWLQNIATNISHIAATSTTAVTCDSGVTSAYRDTTLIEGFTITGGSSSLASNYAVFLASASPTIRYNTIRGGSSPTKSNYGIFLSATSTGPAPWIYNNAITSVLGSTSGTSYGIYLQGSSSLIEKNLISGSSVTGLNYGIGIDHTRPTNITIRNNIIDAGNTTGSSIAGIVVAYSSGAAGPSVAGTILIANNTISGGAGTGFETLGVDISDLSGGLITVNLQHNIIFTSGGAGRVGVFERNFDSRINILTNNLLFDSPLGLYYDQGFNYYTTITSGKPGGIDVATTTTSGNLTAASTAAVFAPGFSVSNLKSWVILSSGPADIGGGAGWSGLGVDIGADAATAGPP